MTSLGICFGLDLSKSTYENGIPKYDIPEDAHLTTTLNTYRDLKFPQPIIILADMGQAFCSVQKLPFGTQQYKEAYQAFWKSFQQEAKKRNWPEIIVQPVDEPGWKDQGEKDRNLALLKYLKEIPGMRTEQDGPGDDYFHNVAGPWSDVWNFNGATGTPEVIEKLHRENKIPLIYNCDVESYRPATARYTTGFFQARSNTRGSFNWAYCSFANDPYSDFDSKHGDWMHISKNKQETRILPFNRMEGNQEGIDDFAHRHAQALITIKNPQDKGNENPGRSAQLNQLLQNVRTRGSFQKPNTAESENASITQPPMEPNYDDASRNHRGQSIALSKDAPKRNGPNLIQHRSTMLKLEKQNQIIYSIAIPTLDTSPRSTANLTIHAELRKTSINFTINTGETPKAQTQFKIFAINPSHRANAEYMNLITANITETMNRSGWTVHEIFFDAIETKGFQASHRRTYSDSTQSGQ